MQLTLRHLASLALSLALCSSPAFTEEERWYQVELLIFSQPSGASEEQWEPLPELAYPETGRFLLHPEQLDMRRAEHDGDSELDETGRLWLYAPQDPETVTADAPASEEATPLPGDTPSEPSMQANASSAQEPTPTPTPFIALPVAAGELHEKAAYMSSRGNYRILFHERWVQPVEDESTALPLLIDRSGDIGDWPPLQGSVKIHIARYLHLETNLWLNTQGEYLPSAEWRMPPPPLGPASIILEQLETPAETAGTAETAEQPAQQLPYFLDESPLTALDDADMVAVTEEATGPVYPWRHAVLLQQQRRMRSNEVHYLDHPLLGVVIKFTPLDEARLQEMAEIEASGEPEPQ